MAIKVTAHIHSVSINQDEIRADVEVNAINGFTQRVTLTANNTALLTAAQVIAGIKTQIIAFALNNYSVTIVASDILITGGLA